ncbi:hypothetical protein Voc01_053890 [Virgisporangium ochraceum]|uniref:Uncharacterized protein n=1 Tax=Virgisporangium ochraceum TaxID=65505 RepID=A0A8J3ZUK5_9ACTN|nr:hypothetical protein Voc01_053890 [Virgisporangium ochraceum]
MRVRAARWADRGFPGTVEVELREADGTVVGIVDKAPVLDLASTPDVELPVELEIPCDVLGRGVDGDGAPSVLVRLHFEIGDDRGRTTFRVGVGDVVTRDG